MSISRKTTVDELLDTSVRVPVQDTLKATLDRAKQPRHALAQAS